jgi:hypothetical protein
LLLIEGEAILGNCLVPSILFFFNFYEDVTRSKYSDSHVFVCLFGPWPSVNFTCGELVERMMVSGMHTVADIFCCCCGQIIGWKYVILSLSYLTFTNLYLETSVVGEIL